MKIKSTVSIRKKTCGILASSAFLIICSYVMIMEKVVDFDSVLKALFWGSIGAVLSGIIGYYMGKVIESPPAKPASDIGDSLDTGTDSDLLIDDIMIDDLKNMNVSEE